MYFKLETKAFQTLKRPGSVLMVADYGNGYQHVCGLGVSIDDAIWAGTRGSKKTAVDRMTGNVVAVRG
jgi:hypothetical protein